MLLKQIMIVIEFAKLFFILVQNLIYNYAKKTFQSHLNHKQC